MNKSFISPWHTLALFAGIGLLIFMGIIFKLDGTTIGPYKLLFPTEEDIAAGTSRKVDMDRLLQDYHEIDMRGTKPKDKSNTDDSSDRSISDTAENNQQKTAPEETYTPPLRDLQWNNSMPFPLKRFFTHLSNNKRAGITRILHYGDSQIEGDRITARLREEMQQQFGGFGPGLQSFTPLVKSWSIRSNASEHWKRYPGFGRKDSIIPHNEYGPLITLSRYHTKDTAELAYIDIAPSKSGYSRNKRYDHLKIYFGHVTDSVRISAATNDSVYASIRIDSTTPSPIHFDLPTPTGLTRLTFDGPSADWYGYSVQGKRGLVVDNIPLRGASGTFFSNIPSTHFTGHFTDGEVRLIILQFGGNVVPYIYSKARAVNYGKRMEREIAIFQSRFPKADFIFIGPSDMGTKVRTQMQTFPHLIDVRDALKEAAFNRGIAYWDIFEAMGGENAMQSWVENDPPLAASDYVHFTPKGAGVVAQWLTDAILDAYTDWKSNEQTHE